MKDLVKRPLSVSSEIIQHLENKRHLTKALAGRVLAAKAVMRALTDSGSANAALETILERTEGKVRDESNSNSITVNIAFNGMQAHASLGESQAVVTPTRIEASEGPRILGVARKRIPEHVQPSQPLAPSALSGLDTSATRPANAPTTYSSDDAGGERLTNAGGANGSHPATGGNDCSRETGEVEQVVAKDPSTSSSISTAPSIPFFSMSLSVPSDEPPIVATGPIPRKRGRPKKTGPISPK